MWSPFRTACLAALVCLPALGAHASPAAPDVRSKSLRIDAASARDGSIAMSQLPVELQRRAVRFHEQQRLRPLSTWAESRLAPRAFPLHAIDDAPSAEASFMAFSVVGEGGARAGFLVLSRVDHAFPISEAPEEGASPGERLGPLAVAAGGRVVRLAANSYVAENAAGHEIGRIGELPYRVSGVDISALADGARTAGTAFFDGERLHEARASVGRDIRHESYVSYEALRADYAQSPVRTIAREVARRNAAAEWKNESLLARGWLELAPGEGVSIPLLDGRGEARVTQLPQSAPLAIERFTDARGVDTLLVIARAPAGERETAELVVDYADGSREEHRFAVHLVGQQFQPLPKPAPIGRTPIVPKVPPTPSQSVVPHTVPVPMARLEDFAPALPDTHPLNACSTMVYFRTHWSTLMGIDRTGTPRGDIPYHLMQAITLERKGPARYAIVLHQSDGGRKYLSGRIDASFNAFVSATPTFTGAAETWEALPAPDNKVFLRSVATRGWLFTDPFGGLQLPGGTAVTVGRVEDMTWQRFEPFCPGVPGAWNVGHPAPNWQQAWLDVRKYDQIPAHRAPSNSQCLSGCGATGWGMLFGWVDSMAERPGVWSPHRNIFTAGGSRAGAPAVAAEWFWTQPSFDHNRGTEAFDPGAAQMIWEVAGTINNWALAGCAHNGQKWTAPQIMAQAHQYFSGRVAMSLTADYDGLGIMTALGRDKAYDVLRVRKRPVILGTGELLGSGHYPLAIAYGRHSVRVWDGRTTQAVALDRFLVYQGWGTRTLETIPNGTWFVGWVHPSTTKGT